MGRAFVEGHSVAHARTVSLPIFGTNQLDAVKDQPHPRFAAQLARQRHRHARIDLLVHRAVERTVAMDADVEHRAFTRQIVSAARDAVKRKSREGTVQRSEPQFAHVDHRLYKNDWAGSSVEASPSQSG